MTAKTAVMIVAAVTLGACGGGGGSEAQPPTVVGDPVVNSHSYPISGQTGYETPVAFKVRSPGGDDLARVPYKVTVLDDEGDPIAATSGSDTFAIRAGEERWVVANVNDVIGAEPARAKVVIYAPDDSDGGRGAQADPDNWQVDDALLNCDTGLTACELTGDLTYTGERAQEDVTITVAVHAGEDPGARIIGGGVHHAEQSTIEPGDTVPFDAYVTVDEGPNRGPFTPTFYVESFGAAD